MEKENGINQDSINAGIFKSIIENSADLTIITDAEGVVTYLSPNCEDVIGYKQAAILGNKIPDFIHPDDAEKCRIEWNRVLAGGSLREFKYRIIDNQGQVRWLSLSAKYITVNGIYQGIQNIIRNITGEEALLQELRKSEEKYRMLVDNNPDVIYTLDSEGRITNVNKALTTVFGFEPQELMGRNFSEFIRKQDTDESEKRFEKVLSKGILENESRIVDKYGNTRYIENHSIRLTDPAADTCVLGIIRDISDRKAMELALRESEEKHRRLVENTPDIITILELNGKLIDINHVARSYSKRDVIGKHRSEFVPLEYIPAHDEAFRNAAEKGVAGTFEYTDKFNNHFFVRYFPFRQANGSRLVMGITTDITELKKAQAELLKSQRLEALGILAGGIAHDFNNLLGGLFGFIELARERIVYDTGALKHIDTSMKYFSRAKELTMQLLTFARGGSPQKEILCITSLLNEAVQLAMSGSDIHIEKCFEEKLYSIEADHGQINQVFTNILINARQAMPNGGTVKIEVRNRCLKHREIAELPAGRYLGIIVKDQGTGIPPDLLPKVFDPFFTTKQAGSGLGLATSYSIVRKHGGHIFIDSELGESTRVSVILPAVMSEIHEETGAVAPLFYGTGAVLFMDDEDAIRDVASKMIGRMGYETVCVKNGEEAISAYRDALEKGTGFNAVILDLTVVGGMGGLETLRKLMEINPNVKAIVSSGYSDCPVLAKPEEYGFSGRIAKPYKAAELARVLTDVLTAEQTQRQ